MDHASTRAMLWLASVEAMTPAKWQELGLLYPTPLDFWLGFSQAAVGPKLYEALQKYRNADVLDQQIEVMHRLKIKMLWFEDEAYPPLLREIDDPPLVLFVRGGADLTHPRPFAIVGSRACTKYGKTQAAQIAGDLSRAGVLVVSGLARGIDVAANTGAIDAGYPTVAVLGHGLDFTYPPEHAPIAQRIVENGGALLSEYTPGMPSMAHHFPQRNRIISGMCKGMLLAEAAQRSGSMITVRLALEQGRDVFVLPGEIGKPNSFQPLKLLREGATPVTCARDILEDMRWTRLGMPEKNPIEQQKSVSDLPISEEGKSIVRALAAGKLSFEELLENTGFSAASLNSHLTMLEIEEIIEQLPGRNYALANRR